jgi:hypothetical protein
MSQMPQKCQEPQWATEDNSNNNKVRYNIIEVLWSILTKRTLT